MRVQTIACGAFVNESERGAVTHLEHKLAPLSLNQRWLFLTNLASAVNERAIPDEIDLVAIGTTGLCIIEIKHWDRGFLKTRPEEVQHEAVKLNDKVRRLVGKLRKSGIDPGFVTGHFLLTKDTPRLDPNRPVIHGCPFFGMNEWRQLLRLEAEAMFDDAMIERAAQILQPKTKIVISGEIRRMANVRNLELKSPPEERFHRMYRGEHIRSRDKVIMHLYDVSASSDSRADRLASREFDALQRLQQLSCVPRLMDSFHEVPNYPGELWYFSLIDPGAPAVAVRSHDLRWTTLERRQFAVRALRALAEIHACSHDGVAFIHRQINPQTLLVSSDNQPVFTAFDLARISATMTVSPSAEAPLTGIWISPEVRDQGLTVADQRSDIYSICGTLISIFDGIDENEAAVVRDTLRTGMAAKADQRASITLLIESLEEDESTATRQPSLPSVRYWSEGLGIPFKDSCYRILSKLGSGSFGTTFKVAHIDHDQEVGTFAAKVVFDPQSGARSLAAFRNARQHSRQSNLATIFEISSEWSDNSFVALMDWIDGTPLSEWIGYVGLYAEQLGEPATVLVERWIESLCSGLAALHGAGLVHGDVSPGNIIESNGELTLIDYDLLVRQHEPIWNVGTPMYAPPGKVVGRPASCADDIYCMSAAMFHVIFDVEPFWFAGQRRCEAGLNWDGIPLEAWGWIPEFLDRGTSLQTDDRFSNAFDALLWIRQRKSGARTRTRAKGSVGSLPQAVGEERAKATPETILVVPDARQELSEVKPMDSTSPECSEQQIPWLAELLETYAGSPRGNIETRGLDSHFAKSTYVPTSLEQELEDQIKRRRVQLVILCGNAGDGKTAFLQHLARELGVGSPQSAQRVWKGNTGGLKLMFNLDGAASFQNQSSDQLLDEIFEPFHDGATNSSKVHLVAVNDGRLLQWAEDYEERHGGQTSLTQWVIDTLLDSVPETAPHIRLINLNARSLVGNVVPAPDYTTVITTEFVDRLLEKLLGGATADAVWKPCQLCTASHRCAAFRSVSMLNDQSEVGKRRSGRVRLRLAEALQAVHQRGQVHITTRELRGTLTYILFGTQHCHDLHANPELDGGDYWDRAFDPESSQRQGEVLSELLRFDPALDSEPTIDRYLRMSKPENDTDSAQAYPEMDSLASRRRRAWFEWSERDIEQVAGRSDLLSLYHGEHLRQFREVAVMNEDERAHLCRRLCEGISRLEQLPRPVLERASSMQIVPLKILPRTPVETTFWVEKPTANFKLESDRPASDFAVEWLPNVLRLTYSSPSGRTETLRMGSDLFSLLIDLADGYQLTDSSSDDVFANLSIFTQRLAQDDESEMFAWSPADETRIHRITIDLQAGVQQLRFVSISDSIEETSNG